MIDGVISTPTLDAGCLPGIIREVLLESDVAVETDLSAEHLLVADEIFLTSSIWEVVGATSIDGRELHADGPATGRARAAVAASD